jgi:hypothetical protein
VSEQIAEVQSPLCAPPLGELLRETLGIVALSAVGESAREQTLFMRRGALRAWQTPVKPFAP